MLTAFLLSYPSANLTGMTPFVTNLAIAIIIRGHGHAPRDPPGGLFNRSVGSPQIIGAIRLWQTL